MRWDVVGFVLGWTIRLVALPLALVAAYMPIKPEREEHDAPTITAMAVSFPRKIPANTTSTRINMMRYLYSVFINASAPLWI